MLLFPISLAWARSLIDGKDSIFRQRASLICVPQERALFGEKRLVPFANMLLVLKNNRYFNSRTVTVGALMVIRFIPTIRWEARISHLFVVNVLNVTFAMGTLIGIGARLLRKRHSMGSAYYKGGAYWKEGAKSNHYGIPPSRLKLASWLCRFLRHVSEVRTCATSATGLWPFLSTVTQQN